MAQLKQDEWPSDREQTTTEQQVERDPVNGPKDPQRPVVVGSDVRPEPPAATGGDSKP